MKPIFFPIADPLTPRSGEGVSEYLSRTTGMHRTDNDWKENEPSLSAAVGAVIERAKKEPDLRSKETQ